jgi:hypothetical protein
MWRLALWLALSFVISILYSAMTTARHLPRLELADEGEDFQSLGISKMDH